MKRLFTLLLLVFAAACGSNSSTPTTPTPPTAPTPTRVISVAGDLNFGQVTVGDSQTRFITIGNSGTAALTITGLTGPCGSSFSVSWTGGAISAGASQTVSLRFAPTGAQNCTGVLTVNGDQTSGSNTIAIVANAVAGYSRNLTGRWRGTIGADSIITLTQTGSTLSGAFDAIDRKGTVSGSVSNTGQVVLTVTIPGFQPFTLNGQADDAGNAISGQVNGSGFQNSAFTLRRI